MYTTLLHGKKTVLRTIRISQDLDDLLQKDAEAKRISLNSLISTMMEKHREWDRYVEKINSVTLSPAGITAILKAVDEKKLVEATKELGARATKEFIPFLFKITNIETYLEFLSLLCRYGRFAQFEIDNIGKDHKITLIHNLGERWSVFLSNFIEQGMKNALGIVPQMDSTKGSVVVRFTAP